MNVFANDRRPHDSRLEALRTLCVLVALAMFAGGCREGATDDAASKPKTVTESGPKVVVDASVEKAQVDIGDKVVYTVRVKYDPAVEVLFPPVLEQFSNDAVEDPGYWHTLPDVGTKKAREITMRFDPGIDPVLVIPPTVIKYKNEGDAELSQVQTEEITVEVTSNAESAGDFREPIDHFVLPEKVVKAEAKDERRVLYIACGALLLVGVIGVLVLRTRRRAAVPPPPPHEVARLDLERLEKMDLLARGEFKVFYYRLTDILRRYIEQRFGIMAPEQTTEEFLVAMRRHAALGLEHKRLLEEYLAIADMVKFAKFTPAVDEAKRALATAVSFIEATADKDAKATAPAEVTHAV